MAAANLPAAESQIVTTLAKLFDLTFDDLCAPVLKAKSFLASSAAFGKVEGALGQLTWSNVAASLKVLAGIYMSVEGVLIIGNAGKLGIAVVEVIGIGAVTPAAAALIGIGLAVLGGYLLLKGLVVLAPMVKERMRREFGSAWDVLFG